MAGHIPILRPDGDNIVRTGAALTQPGLEAVAVTAQLPCRSRVRQAEAATDTPAGARSGASAHRDKDVSTTGSQAAPSAGRAHRPRAPPAFRTVDPAGSDVAEPRAEARRPSQRGPDMAAPTATAALNASVFAPGDQMLLTVTYSDADTKPLTVTIVVTDAQGNSSAPVKVTAVIDPLTVTVTDNSGRTWTRVSDNGSVAVYRSVA